MDPTATAGTAIDEDAALRMAATDSLVTFAELMHSTYRASAVHRLIARKLEECYARKIRRLAISLPPRSGKSLLASAMFPAWALTKDPKLQIIQASYSAELAESFSQLAKGVLRSAPYQQIFPAILNPDINRAREWRTLSGGQYYATGVGGGGVGRGASIYLVDDPLKNREEASSEAVREMLYQWYVSSALTRLTPDGVMIVIGTRWNEDDLIGRLTNPERVRQLEDAGHGGEAFTVLNLSALCEDPATDPLGRQFGESLWPERWPASKLAQIKIEIGGREFDAQYQGRPSPPGGNLCDISKIKLIDRTEVPKDLQLVRGWDLALGVGKSNDYSVGALGGYDQKTGSFYLANINRGKRLWPAQKSLIVELAKQEAIGGKIALETVAAWSACRDEVQNTLRGEVKVESILPAESKEGRAQGWLNKVDGSQFFMVRGAWNQDFLHELQQFPNGAHDDQVDAVSICWQIVGRRRQPLLLA